MTGIQDIEEYVSEVVKQFHPEKVILFGSHGTGDANEHSDVDLLVVMQFDGRPSQQALAIRQKLRKNFPLDLIVQTPAQSKRRLRERHPLITEAFNKGRVLYEKS